MNKTGIYSDEGQMKIEELRIILQDAQKKSIELYNMSTSEHTMDDMNKVEASIRESMRILGTNDISDCVEVEDPAKTYDDLFEYVIERLMVSDCDETLKLTKQFCDENNVDFEALTSKFTDDECCDCTIPEKLQGVLPFKV